VSVTSRRPDGPVREAGRWQLKGVRRGVGRRDLAFEYGFTVAPQLRGGLKSTTHEPGALWGASVARYPKKP